MKNGKLAIDWSWFPKARDTLVEKIAPYTAKAIGPILTAVTGVNVPNPADVINGVGPARDQAKDLLIKMLDQPISGDPNSIVNTVKKKVNTMRGRGFKELPGK